MYSGQQKYDTAWVSKPSSPAGERPHAKNSKLVENGEGGGH